MHKIPQYSNTPLFVRFACYHLITISNEQFFQLSIVRRLCTQHAKNAVDECKTMLETCMSILILLGLTQICTGNYNGGMIDTYSPLMLLGSQDAETSKMQFPFKVWQNPRKSAFKPRKRDLHETKLLQLMGDDYDHKWMRKNREKQTINGAAEETERKAVRALRALVDNSTLSRQEDLLQLPEDLPGQYRELVKNWLVRRATCPIRFTWNDLGPYFWPRFVKLGECMGNMTCSWPPGMTCAPGAAKILNILRWHCRERKSMKKIHNHSQNHKRKNANQAKKHDNNVAPTDTSKSGNKINSKRKKRKKYRCMWIKVPYPVPEDCVCSCGG